MGELEDVSIENVNCIRSASQPVIFNWQEEGPHKMRNVTLSNVTVHNYGTKAGAALTPMNGKYPDAHNNGLANAYGIWARGVDGLTVTGCSFSDDGDSKREKFVFDPSVKHLALDDRPKDSTN